MNENLQGQLAAANQANDIAFTAARPPKRYHWTPQEDMTAYELALLIPVFIGADIEDVLRVRPALRRHLMEMV